MCNFSGMIKNVLPSLRQRAGPQRICSRQKSVRSGTARDSFSQTPHMRGKGGGASHIVAVLGITPAHAGKSGQQPSARPCRRDHPPRMRGKVVAQKSAKSTQRITPACAGKSAVLVRHAPPVQDHPRTCGKKGRKAGAFKLAVGSPPRMRGKDAHPPRSSSPGGITPACAGKSTSVGPNNPS